MKWIKTITIGILVIGVFFFAFYKPNKISLEGSWPVKEIILDGKKIYPDTLAQYLDVAAEIVIDQWSKSISVPIYRKDVKASVEYLGKSDGKDNIRLSSGEKALNGDFEVSLDTFDIQPLAYTVDVNLKSNKTLIHFQKRIIIPPYKPDLPRRGKV